MNAHGLGRRRPSDDEHVRKYRLTAAFPEKEKPLRPVEKTLKLPSRYRPLYHQGREGACVGYALSWMMSFLNGRLYAARDLWEEAKKIDEWEDTNPGDNEGTSIRAGCDVLRTLGHRRAFRGITKDWDPNEGIAANRWATSVDEIRACIEGGVPVTLGVNWYHEFDRPQAIKDEFWIAKDSKLTAIRGGHAICCYAASDSREAVKLVNSWGREYPLVWMPYAVLERLLQEDGEATLITDR